LIGGFCAGLLLTFAGKINAASARLHCRSNLRQIGFTLVNYHDTYGQFPAACMKNDSLPLEKRLSWIVSIVPFVESSNLYVRMDKAKAWDAEETRFAAVMAYRIVQCPAYPRRPDTTFTSTHFVGISGIGADAAALPTADTQAGFFGHERK